MYLSFSQDFISIKSKSNLRAGPGQQYPIKWILKYPNLPVKVLEVNSSYTKVELHDGTRGWVWNATTSKKNYYIITEDTFIIDKNKNKIALIKKNVLLEQIKCIQLIEEEEYCKINKKDFKGYIKKKSIWGISNTKL
tara:strand:- start:120 stop:530 length:411 start_codon:yes stop_codon:yes gene_type:complete